MRSALILGVTGQDGSYLSDFLLSKGYEVHGIKRRSSSFNTGRVDHLMDNPRFHLHYGDVCDGAGLTRLIYELRPDEVYNLAAQSHVRVSFEIPEYTGDATGMGALRLFEALRSAGSKARVYQASSSEMFGNESGPQNELTPFRPRSPYGCAKVFAHNCAVNYRESYGMFIACGILFNHESTRRGETFVTRKIAMAAARIHAGLQNSLTLGNLTAKRDWGLASEYVEAMWMMLQQDEPDDFVIGTGESHSVRDFAMAAFDHLGMDWERYVTVDGRYERPAEINNLLADPEKASVELGWQAETMLPDLVRLMVDAEVRALSSGVSASRDMLVA